MTESRSALAGTLHHLDALLEHQGKSRAEVLDVEELAREACLPADVVTTLLNGGDPPEQEFTDRVIGRIKMLRETRTRQDGKLYSWREIAESFNASPASISNLVSGHGKAGPLASTQAGIERFFFSEPTGFLSAEPASALNSALQAVVSRLQTSLQGGDHPGRNTSLEHLGVRGGALRSATALPDADWELVESLIKRLVQDAQRERRDG
ncbi:hypothetical protein ACFXMT_22425 [Streptomyces mirabilis]|uniref:hypothetical protein n=1 Tax=Streptomyces mirabilis TaxID=68239 RepID=UPI0036763298